MLIDPGRDRQFPQIILIYKKNTIAYKRRSTIELRISLFSNS